MWFFSISSTPQTNLVNKLVLKPHFFKSFKYSDCFVKFCGSFEEMSPYRYQIGLRGEGFYTSTDALFLRKIDTVKQMDVDSEKQYSYSDLYNYPAQYNLQAQKAKVRLAEGSMSCYLFSLNKYTI